MKLKIILLSFCLITTYSINAENHSYIWGMHFPNLIDPPEQCCFDYTGDGIADNKLGDSLSQFDTNGTLQPAIDAGIITNTIVKAIDWQNLDLSIELQDFSFQFLNAENYTPDLTLDERMSGLTMLYISPNQSENVFDASIDNGLLTATADSVSGLLNLQFDAELGLEPLTIHNVRAEAQLLDSPEFMEPGTYSEDLPATNPEIVGGIKIGGLLTSEDFLGVLDSQYRTCECAGVDPDEALISTTVFFGTLVVSCSQSNLTPENCPTASFCSTINTFCDNAIGLGLTFDVDSNNDNVKDAYSVGLRLGASATTLMDIIYKHGFEN